MNTQRYTVNVRVGGIGSPRVAVSQGDIGRRLVFNLFDGAVAFAMTSGTTATIVGRKPSGLGFAETCTHDGGNSVSVRTTEAMTQEAGKIPAELRISDGTKVIGTANFVFYVEPSPHPDGTTDGTLETMDDIQTQIGDLSDLTTSDKSSLVGAINEAAQSGGSEVVIDATLTQSGQAADAKATGDEISGIKADLKNLEEKNDLFLKTIKYKVLNVVAGEVGAEGTYYGTLGKITTGQIYGHKGDVIKINPTLKYFITYYDDDLFFISNTYSTSGWITGNYILTRTGYFVITATHNTTEVTSFTQNEVYGIVDNEYLTMYTDTPYTTVNGINFEPGHIDTTNADDIFQRTGRDYKYAFIGSNAQAYLIDTRYRTVGKVNLPAGTTIAIRPGYRFYIFTYSGDTVTLGGWNTTNYKFEVEATVRIIVDNTSKINVVDWPDLADVITIAYPNELNAPLLSASGYNTYASGGYSSPVGTKSNLTFAVISDLHGDSEQFKKFIEDVNTNSKLIDNAVCLGDIVLRQPSESITWFNTDLDSLKVPLLYVVGNHDVSDTGLSGLSIADVKTKYFNTIIGKGWMSASNFGDSNNSYWYKDYINYKIRVIALYEYGNTVEVSTGASGAYCRRWIDTAQLQWFADTLYNTPTDYSVVVLLHQIPTWNKTDVDNDFMLASGYRGKFTQSLYLNTIDGNPIPDIVHAFVTGSNISQTYNSTTTYPESTGKTATVTKDFTSRGTGNFICFLHGHFHAPLVTKNATYTYQIAIGVPSGSNSIYQRSFDDIFADDVGSHNYYYVSFDTEHKQIKLIKKGRNVTNDMRQRIATAINY